MIEPAPDPLARLRRVAEFQRAVACGLSSAPELAADLAWHADALAAVAAGADPARAFGLKRGPGQRAPETDASARRRDELLRQARAEHFGTLSACGASRAILSVAAKVDRLRSPPKPGTPEAVVHAAAQAAPLPTTPRRLKQILQFSERGGM